VNVSRSGVRHQPTKPASDKDLIAAIEEIAVKHRRYGYRRVWALLKRKGHAGMGGARPQHAVNVKRVHRLCKALGLSQRRKVKKRRATPTEEPVTKAQFPRHVYTYDIIEDRTENGNKLRILSVLDEYTRECVCLQVERSINARKVVETLDFVFLSHGAPKRLRSDNGGEFAATAVKEWLREKDVSPSFIEPGSPWQNGYVESFHDKLRRECLDMEVFRNGNEARVVIEAWREHYNRERPHSSLGYKTPAEYLAHWNEEHKLVEERNVEFIASLAASGAPDQQAQGVPEERPATGLQPSGSALGSLSSVALPSDQTTTIINHGRFTREAIRSATNHTA
jgi:putative transposase